MPPRTRFTAQRIVEAAIVLLREHGSDALSARTIAGAIGCSTAPVFHHFSTMDALLESVMAEISMDLIQDMLASNEADPLQTAGKAMIRFAVEEPRLYEALFLRHHPHRIHWGRVRRDIAESMAAHPRYHSLDADTRFGLVGRCAVVAHGLGLEIWSHRIETHPLPVLHSMLFQLTDPIIDAVLRQGHATDIHSLSSKRSAP